MHPRIFAIPATRAPVLAVLRRGPSAWMNVGRWDVDRLEYQSGAWIRGTLYPQRCDLSPDGRWLCSFALKGSVGWKLGQTYVAVSRLPWLSALAAWGTAGTWTRGMHFVEDPRDWAAPDPDHGEVGPVRERFGLAVTPPETFAVERRRGWTETADTPPRDPGDMWDERRAERVTMEKSRPGSHGSARLTVRGWYAAFRRAPGKWGGLRYTLVTNDRARELADVQWADWSAAGRLLVATTDGRLQIRDVEQERPATVWETDIGALTPDPSPPPPEASTW